MVEIRAAILLRRSQSRISVASCVSRKVVRNLIPSDATEFRYERKTQPILNICPRWEQLEGLSQILFSPIEGVLLRNSLRPIGIYLRLR